MIVATVCQAEARWDTNQLGDVLIFTRASLCLEPDGALKGSRRPEYVIDIEGGTVGDITLQLAHLPLLRVGDRALFLLERGHGNVYELAGDGLGFFQFDNSGRRVTDYFSTLTISMSEVRVVAASNRKKTPGLFSIP